MICLSTYLYDIIFLIFKQLLVNFRLTHEKEATQALIEQDQIGRTKRKEAFNRVTQNFYKIVCTIEEAEKRKIADLEEKVAGAEAARKRLQQKVLQTKST